MNPSPVTVSSPSPGTGAAPIRVRAAKPADASSAMAGALQHGDRAVAAGWQPDEQAEAGQGQGRPRDAGAVEATSAEKQFGGQAR